MRTKLSEILERSESSGHNHHKKVIQHKLSIVHANSFLFQAVYNHCFKTHPTLLSQSLVLLASCKIYDKWKSGLLSKNLEMQCMLIDAQGMLM